VFAFRSLARARQTCIERICYMMQVCRVKIMFTELPTFRSHNKNFDEMHSAQELKNRTLDDHERFDV